MSDDCRFPWRVIQNRASFCSAGAAYLFRSGICVWDFGLCIPVSNAAAQDLHDNHQRLVGICTVSLS